MSDDTVNAQQLAKLSGETYDAMDHWSEKGLLVFNRRGQRRLYPRDPNVQRVKPIRAMQVKGHSLDGIKDSLSGRNNVLRQDMRQRYKRLESGMVSG